MKTKRGLSFLCVSMIGIWCLLISNNAYAASSLTIRDEIKAANYGDKVDYSVTSNGVSVDDWRILYEDTNNVYIISNIINRNSFSDTVKNCLVWGSTIKNNDYAVELKNHSTHKYADLLSCLNSSLNWGFLLDSNLALKSAQAFGGVKIEMFMKSWNAKYELTEGKLAVIGSATGPSIIIVPPVSGSSSISFPSDGTNLIGTVPGNDELFFPANDVKYGSGANQIFGYVLAEGLIDSKLLRVLNAQNGSVKRIISVDEGQQNEFGIRPYISLPKNKLALNKVSDSEWVIGEPIKVELDTVENGFADLQATGRNIQISYAPASGYKMKEVKAIAGTHEYELTTDCGGICYVFEEDPQYGNVKVTVTFEEIQQDPPITPDPGNTNMPTKPAKPTKPIKPTKIVSTALSVNSNSFVGIPDTGFKMPQSKITVKYTKTDMELINKKTNQALKMLFYTVLSATSITIAVETVLRAIRYIARKNQEIRFIDFYSLLVQ